MKFSAWILTTALVVPLAAAGQNGTQKNTDTGKPAKISLQGEHFLTVLANEDQSEIELAKLALKKSSNPKVQQYAKTDILAADPAMEQQAKIIAQQSAAAPGFPTPSDKAEYYFLSKLSGKDFDQAYMNFEDARQHEDLITVQHEADGAKNPDLKKFAQKEVVPVRKAADAAQQIALALSSSVR